VIKANAPPGYIVVGHHYDDIYDYVIDDETAGMIADTEQKPELNVQIIISAVNEDHARSFNSTNNDLFKLGQCDLLHGKMNTAIMVDAYLKKQVIHPLSCK
jgi:hypothetical protein